jgi:hypothetical protein
MGPDLSFLLLFLLVFVLVFVLALSIWMGVMYRRIAASGSTSGSLCSCNVCVSVADLWLVWISRCLPSPQPVLWVPEGNLAGNFRAEFLPIFGQAWPPNPSRSTGLVVQCWLHHKSAPQTNILKPFRGTKKPRPDRLQLLRCSCHRITYCDVVCQARHWSVHRLVCLYHSLRVVVRAICLAQRLDSRINDIVWRFLKYLCARGRC